MSLDKLRELDAAASGPAPIDDEATCTNTDPCPGYDAVIAHEDANTRLAALSHLVLPLAEALERLLLAHSLACGDSLTGAREGDEGRAALAELEKALG